jgi:hypothetical protein
MIYLMLHQQIQIVFAEEENRIRSFRTTNAAAHQEEKQRRREQMELKLRDREYNLLTLQMYVQTMWVPIVATVLGLAFGLFSGLNWPSKIKCSRTDPVCVHARVKPGLYLSK